MKQCKKIRILILLFVFVILGIFTNKVSAVEYVGGTGSDDKFIRWEFDTETETLTITGTGTIVAFNSSRYSKLDVKHLKIGEGIEIVGDGVFSGFENLEDIEFPESLTDINYYAFNACKNLKSINLPKNLKMLSWKSFGGSSLTSVTIPKSVEDIANPFSGCEKLVEIIVEDGNKNYISENGILYNKDKTELVSYPIGRKDERYVIPDTVSELGLTIFEGVKNLKYIVMPNSVKKATTLIHKDCSELIVYCKSDNELENENYSQSFTCKFIHDENGPSINIDFKDKSIIINAEDEGAGLHEKAYSINGIDWQESNTFAVTKNGTYKIYVRDAL